MRKLKLGFFGLVTMVFLVACLDASPMGAEDTEDMPSGDIESGLVAHYPFSGNAKDASGNGNHAGEMVNVTAVADRNGNASSAYEFGSVPGTAGSEIVVPPPESVPQLSLESPTTSGTIAAWVNVYDHSAAGSPFAPILMKSKTNGNGPFMYQAILGSFEDRDDDGDGKAEATYATSMSIQFNSYVYGHEHRAYSTANHDFEMNRWYHVAIAWDNGNVRHYVDGKLINAEPLTGFQEGAIPEEKTETQDTRRPLVIGADYPGVTEFFRGTLDEIRIYNRALTDEDVALLFQTD
jgi:hypothetical protein